MPGPSANETDAACAGKEPFATYGEAIRQLVKVLRRHGTKWPMMGYRCQVCGNYHYGHVPADKLPAGARRIVVPRLKQMRRARAPAERLTRH